MAAQARPRPARANQALGWEYKRRTWAIQEKPSMITSARYWQDVAASRIREGYDARHIAQTTCPAHRFTHLQENPILRCWGHQRGVAMQCSTPRLRFCATASRRATAREERL